MIVTFSPVSAPSETTSPGVVVSPVVVPKVPVKLKSPLVSATETDPLGIWNVWSALT